jgi:leucyl aminopeptidase (aminopeptidase T)
LRSILRGPKQQLATVSPEDREALAETDVYIFTMGPRAPVPWGSIPKVRRSLVSVWLDTRYDRTPYARTWARIAKTHGVRMLAIEATLATPERAQAQGLNYNEWRQVMFRGCMADHGEISKKAKALSKLLSGKRNVSVETMSGTSLSFALDRRPVGISDGISTEKMAGEGKVTFLPAGAVEVSADERSANGRIVYETPVRMGNERVESLAISLKDGRVREYQATKGADAFEHYLKSGGKDTGRFAFFGFGLNPNLRLGYTQDDKVLGGLTLGFGSNERMGGKSIAREQWWVSLPKATVEIDGTTVMKKGKLLA